MAKHEQEDLGRALAARARAYMNEGYHCSESVLMAVGPTIAADWHPACARLATPFGGGVGGTRQDLCGAVAGGVMAIGSCFGRTTVVDDAPAYRLAAAFRERFLAEFGTTRCGEIRESLIDVQGGPGTCAPLVERTVILLLEVLAEAES